MPHHPGVPNVFRISSSSNNLLNDLNLNKKNYNGDFDLSNQSILKIDCSYDDNTINNINSLKNDRTPKRSSLKINNITYEKNSYLLWIVTPVAASFSVAIIIAALAGPLWLLTEEKIRNTNYNGTANYNANDDGVYLTKYTKSSLWILCATQGAEYHCTTIDYFPNEEYSPDPNDSTMAIPYAITRSTPFFLFSGIVLIISYILFLMAMCSQQHGIYYFTSGILFIISGLLMLIGLIMYISVFKAEVGSKLRPKSSLQPALFTFKYGQSFLLYVIGFIITEFVGILNVFLYIKLLQLGNDKSVHCFGYYSTSNVIKNIDAIKFTPINDGHPFACRKHTNPCFSSIKEKRYYFEKPSKCDVHHKNLTKSLNELYTEPGPPISPWHDYPPKVKKLTRSVSTATEIFPNIDYNSMKKNLSFSKDNLKTITNEMCGITKNILTVNRNDEKSKDKQFNDILCKKTTIDQRSKPKDIYFIENDTTINKNDVYIVDAKQPKHQKNRKPNIFSSNKSLTDYIGAYPKTEFDLDNRYSNNRQEDYFTRNNRIDNSNIYHSRTLPRNFMKRSFDGDSNFGRRVSASGLFVPFKEEHQTNYQQNVYHRKSCDTMDFPSHYHSKERFPIEMIPPPKWPSIIARSPSNFSIGSQNRCFSTREFYPDDYLHGAESESPSLQNEVGIFDLDRIERERRKSHANLFDGINYNDSYDYGKSTAV